MKSKVKLEIELIPQTSHFRNVRSEVKAARWDYLRRDCYKKAGYRCEICNGKGKKWPVECHEVWDYNTKDEVQKLVRLIALCPDCHSVKHWGLSQLRGLENRCIKHIAKVNGWNKGQVHKHVTEAFKIWHKRNETDWVLDLTHLETL